MQLSLKRKGDYAVRAMISVGRHHGSSLRQARQISTEMNIPYKTLTLILAGLVAEGLLVAAHGPRGGYRLARPPSDISLLDIVEAAEGPATFDHCVLRDGPCDWEQTCPVHDTWARTQAALTRELASTSLAEMAGIDAAIEAQLHASRKPLPMPGSPIDTAPATSRPPPGSLSARLRKQEQLWRTDRKAQPGLMRSADALPSGWPTYKV